MSAVMAQPLKQAGIEVIAQASGQADVLTPAALAFLDGLHARFESVRQARLKARGERQAFFDAGGLPDFRDDTRAIRDCDWKIAPLPKALLDRRVEITGPVDPKMVINALNSGAKVYMADFEDSTAPTWDNLIAGQRALIDAVRGTLEFTADSGKHYALRPFEEQAVLMVRPRGWHLDEKHVLVDGAPMSASLFDLGLFARPSVRPESGQNSSTSRSSGYRARCRPAYGERVIGRTPVGCSPRLSSQIRGSTCPTTRKCRKVNGGLSVGKGSAVVITWKCRCGVAELPLLPISPRTWPDATRSPSRTLSEPGFRWA